MEYLIRVIDAWVYVYKICEWLIGDANPIFAKLIPSIDLNIAINELNIKPKDVLFVEICPYTVSKHIHNPETNFESFKNFYVIAVVDDACNLFPDFYLCLSKTYTQLALNIVSKPAIECFEQYGIKSIWMPVTYRYIPEHFGCTTLDFDDPARIRGIAHSCEMRWSDLRQCMILPLIQSNIPFTLQHHKYLASFGPKAFEDNLALWNRHLGSINVSRGTYVDYGQHMVHRTWQIVLSKSCLFQHMPTEDSGFYEIFTDGQTCVIWNQPEDLIEKARDLIVEHPEKSIQIAKNAYEMMQIKYHTRVMRQIIFDYLVHHKLFPNFCTQHT